MLNVVTFTEADGRTTLELLVQCPNQEIRDAIMDSGMEIGMQEQYDVLEQLVMRSTDQQRRARAPRGARARSGRVTG